MQASNHDQWTLQTAVGRVALQEYRLAIAGREWSIGEEEDLRTIGVFELMSAVQR